MAKKEKLLEGDLIVVGGEEVSKSALEKSIYHDHVVMFGENENKVKSDDEEHERIAILLKHFTHSENSTPHLLSPHIRCWERGQIIRDENEIKELLALKAPVEIWYKNHANRQSKG